MTIHTKRNWLTTIATIAAIMGVILLSLSARATVDEGLMKEAWVHHWERKLETGLTDSLVSEYRETVLALRKAEPEPLAAIDSVKTPPITPSQPSITRAKPSGEWASLVSMYFASSQVNQALSVLQCESKGNPNAQNSSSSAAGLFQFVQNTWDWVAGETGSPTYAQGGPFDAEWNVINAAWLSNGGKDWSHWQCKP